MSNLTRAIAGGRCALVLSLARTLSACASPPSHAAAPVAAAVATAPAASPDSPSPPPLVRYPGTPLALTHVRLFDGTLAAARSDQTIVVAEGRIVSVGPSSTAAIPAGVAVLDLAGRSVFPGLVGMHNHLYYIAVAFPPEPGARPLGLLPELAYSGPRLYLAGGVTTMRTTGSVEPYADLNLKRLIDEGRVPGPDIDVTAPYMEGPGGFFPQMSEIRGAEDAVRFVAFWADAGATSFKAYMHLSRAALRAAIAEAHRRHLKVTGHLCAVTYAEAAEMGIDDLEHGFFASTDLDAGKKPDVCPPDADDRAPVLMGDPDAPEARALVRTLVAHHVALTSTLPVFEDSLPGRSPDPRAIALLTPGLREDYRARRAKADAAPPGDAAVQFRHELAMERAFVAAGGLLLAGPDPTGLGGVLPGFGDQREIELLVEAGFSAVEALHIATSNGAAYLGRLDDVGTIAAGKRADLVVVRGDPGARIADVENVETVFKRGVGYDPRALMEAVRGRVGQY